MWVNQILTLEYDKVFWGQPNSLFYGLYIENQFWKVEKGYVPAKLQHLSFKVLITYNTFKDSSAFLNIVCIQNIDNDFWKEMGQMIERVMFNFANLEREKLASDGPPVTV